MPKTPKGLRCVCGGKIRVTNTYIVCASIQTKNSKCEVCGRSYTIKTEIIREVKGKGDGAFAEASKLRREFYGVSE